MFKKILAFPLLLLGPHGWLLAIFLLRRQAPANAGLLAIARHAAPAPAPADDNAPAHQLAESPAAAQ